MHAIQPLNLNEALDRILATLAAPTKTEIVPLAQARLRVAARSVQASVSLPPFVSSAMDGYAFARATDLRTYRLVGTSLAGHPFRGTPAAGECVRVTTGAALPSGTDTVAIQEDCVVAVGTVTLRESVQRGDHVRAIGNDVTIGTTIASTGTVLGPFEIGWLAACGVASVSVFAKPSVAVFSTGDELREPGTALDDGSIYDSNRWVVAELLANLPVDVFNAGVLPDDPETTRLAISRIANEHDALITSGGVSVGDADHVKTAIEELGSLEFWRLNLKPGKPVAFGRLGKCLLFGLPGNPVSAIVTCLLIAKPALLKLAGVPYRPPAPVSATLTTDLFHRPGREEYQRGRFELRDGTTVVEPTGDQGSNRLASFATANCLIRVPADASDLARGATVEILPLRGLLSA